MKRFENIFRTLFLLVSIVGTRTAMHAQESQAAYMDSVEIGLLTCSPHNEVYSLYGHTAIHYHDLHTNRHWVFNYGVFDFKKPHFVWRFIMGQTDYRLEATTNLNAWCQYYRKWGSQVEEQILDLTPTEKLRLRQALADNLRDPVYRYNFFYDNCSTRPRNIIEKCLEGEVAYAPREDSDDVSFRQIIHRCTEQHPWAAFGNDLLLGLGADRTTTQREQQFLPQNLYTDFDRATISRPDGPHKLVKRKDILVPLGQQTAEKEFPLSPRACTLLLLIVSTIIAVYEWKRRTILYWWDALLMLVTGLAGCILLLMFFSAHPTTSTNLQILLLNPLALLFLPTVVRRRPTRWFRISEILLCAFLLGSIVQEYAEGMLIVALCLLIRCMIHRYNDK